MSEADSVKLADGDAEPVVLECKDTPGQYLDSKGNLSSKKTFWRPRRLEVTKDPEDREALIKDIGVSNAKYVLPASIYTGLVLLPLLFDPNQLKVKRQAGWTDKIAQACIYGVFFQYFIAYCFCLSIQALLMYYVVVKVWDIEFFEQNKCPADYFVVTSGFSAFYLSVFRDLFETAGIIRWLWKVPTVEKFQPITSVPVPYGRYVLLTLSYKVFVFIFVIIPKLSLAGFLFGWGPNFIAQGENTDVILNCVALAFIFDLDDYCYELFTPAMFRRVLDFEKTEVSMGLDDNSTGGKYPCCEERIKSLLSCCSALELLCGLCCGTFIVLGVLVGAVVFNYSRTCGAYLGT